MSSKLLTKYQNGNYNVYLYEDGSKIRFSNDDYFKPSFPESIDIKITDYCDKLCKMCHEKSSIKGKHALFNENFLKTLKSGTELAIGGGNPLSHPELLTFLEMMKAKKIICNLTINQEHLLNHQELLNKLLNEKLIYGLGISLNEDKNIDKIMDFIGNKENCVIHVIAGIISLDILNKISNKNCKLLILGYKNFGRGIDFYSNNIERNIDELEKNILDISLKFCVVSFDNLAIKQLKMKEKVKDFDTLYMGDDGAFTMYIDLVNKEYAINSTSLKRYPLKNNIEEMFQTLKKDDSITS